MSSFPEDITTVIRDLHRNLSSSLLPHVALSSDRKIRDEDVTKLIGVMSGWYRLLCLGGWLESMTISGMTDPSIPIPFIGEKMVSRLMSIRKSDTGLRNEGMDNLKVLAFAVILQELGHKPEVERLSHIDLTVGVYISLYDAVGSSSK